ncbi:acyl-CoA dehydrogenase family protein [Anaeromyxobacter paludicola]|uniref:Acyl-CoA dehydrogenase n=1 Tax=Anaeromyxobacter paludicola TaxID=2918171 RepID=A0ABN6NA46_9BACT|nr:acyl-CoA dehydrogenase family protein [Anaeromyxobacter paludicola]BDG10112.1 acyl-CoA dehydrogenase [Anaeromyxobacter paludicola]
MADVAKVEQVEQGAKRAADPRRPGGGEYLIADAAPADVFTPEDFTEEQRAIGDTAEGFVQDSIWPRAEEMEKQHFEVAVALMKQCGELGLLAIDVPEAFGGLELDKATSMLAAERIAPAGSFSVTWSAHTGIATLPLVYYGTEAQKAKYLTKLASGEWIGAYCLTEPGSGSDALGARTTAKLSADGTHYVLEGTKQFITNGSFADLFTVFAKVDGEHFTAFLVERGFPGVTVGAEEKKLGIKGSSTTQIILEGARVPVENVLGEIGKGHKIAFNVLNVGRFKLGAAVTGAAKHALGEGARYANLRKQFDTPIARFGAIRQKLAEGAASIFASESVVYRLAGLLDRRLAAIPRDAPGYYELYQKAIEDYAIECAISKVFCSEVLAGVVDEVVQIHGGYGFTQEYAAERFYRDERINRIFEGTNEINRLLVPGTLLRRAMKGEIPLQREVMKAVESLLSPSYEEVDAAVPFAVERAALGHLKKAFLVVAGAAVQRYRGGLKDEQEVLLALADVAIEIFALESALLRAEKGAALPERRRAVMAAAVKVFAFGAVERIGTAARKAAFCCAEGDELTMLLAGVRRFTKYDASGLLQAQRLLADAVLEGEKYPC